MRLLDLLTVAFGVIFIPSMDGRVTTTDPVLALAEVNGVDEVDEVDGRAVEEKEDAAFNRARGLRDLTKRP